MPGRVLLASILAAVLMFAWGFVFWVVLGFGDRLMQPLPAELDVLAALRNVQAPSGMYAYPMLGNVDSEDARAEFERKHLEGPLLQLAYRKEGGPPMPLFVFAQGFGHYFAVALVTSCLLVLAARGLPRYSGRLVFVLLVSLVAAIWGNVGDVVWFLHSPVYCVGSIVYAMGAGLVMGLVLAAIDPPPGG